MPKTIKIYRGVVPKTKAPTPPAPKNSPKPEPPSIVGKAVSFLLSPDGPRVIGVVRAKQGTVLEVAYAIPNSVGVLVVAKNAVTHVLADDVKPIEDAVILEGRDVKAWESRDPVEGVKAAREIKNGDDIIDYRDVTFEGYGSTFEGTTPSDRDGDYVVPGAFDQSLRRFRENPVMLTDHYRSVKNLMGRYDKVGVNARGLALQGIVTNSPHEDARHVRFQLMEGALKTLSIGGSFFYRDDYRGIEEIDLHEVSLVVIPANPDALFQVRQIDGEFAGKALALHAKRNGGEVRQKIA